MAAALKGPTNRLVADKNYEVDSEIVNEFITRLIKANYYVGPSNYARKVIIKNLPRRERAMGLEIGALVTDSEGNRLSVFKNDNHPELSPFRREVENLYLGLSQELAERLYAES